MLLNSKNELSRLKNIQVISKQLIMLIIANVSVDQKNEGF